jgi:hypothetical protein
LSCSILIDGGGRLYGKTVHSMYSFILLSLPP